MKKIVNFLRSNKLAVILFAVCIVISMSAAGDKVRRQKLYIDELSCSLNNAANSIGLLTNVFVDAKGNVKKEYFRMAEDSFERLNQVQRNGKKYADGRFCDTDAFFFINQYTCKILYNKEFIDNDEVEFLKNLQNDLLNLAEELDRCKDAFLFVDIKGVNQLLEEFGQKYDSDPMTYEVFFD